MAVRFQVTFDSNDPAALAGFWAEALHYETHLPSAGDDWAALADPDGAGPRVYIQRVPEAKTAKNRVHLDLRAAEGATDAEARTRALDAECDRLVALGARLVQRLEPDGENDLCLVMQDPQGNEFCLD